MWNDLHQMPEGIQTRWTSPENFDGAKGGACRGNDGRKRSAAIPLKAGETAVLARIEGTSGTVRRIWATISDNSPAMLRGLRLRMTWDGAPAPAVDAPIADFFCQPLGKFSAFENALFSNPEGRSFNTCAPMAFRESALITLTNESGKDLRLLFYDVNLTLGDRHGPEMLYFHAHWRRENPTQIGVDYAILPQVRGRGRFLGVNLGVVSDKARYERAWWGEGEIKMYLDGDTEHPTLCGTGTEDYIGTAWGQGRYSHAYQGSPLAEEEVLRFGFYRLHLPDPVWFYEDLRVDVQQIGCCGMNTAREWKERGITLYLGQEEVVPTMEEKAVKFERQDDWSSCAWFYLDSPVNGLPELPPFAERVAGLDENIPQTQKDDV